MAISVNTVPEDICIAGNPQILDLTSDKRLLSAGNPAAVELQFGNDGVDGDGWTMRYDVEEFTFTIKSVPNDSGFELPEFSDVPTFNDFVEELKNNFYIDRDFIVTTDTTNPIDLKLTLTHKLNGIRYNLFLTGQTGVSVAYTNGVDDDYAESFSPYCRIYGYVNNAWTLLNEKSQYADLDGNFQFQINQELMAQFNIPLPEIDYSGAGFGDYIFPFPEALLKYYVVYNERYGKPPIHYKPVSFGSEAAPKLATPIRVDRQEFPGIDLDARFFSGDDTDLLRVYRPKTIHKSQIDYFVWYFPDGNIGDDMQIGVVDHYMDGTTGDTVYSEYELPAAADAGFYQMVIDASTLPSDVRSFDIYGLAAGKTPDQESNRLNVFVDHFDYEHIYFMMYQNQFGMFETVYFTGRLEVSGDFEREDAVLSQSADYSKNDAEVINYSHRRTDEFSLDTGLKKQEEFEGLKDLINSPRVYFLDGVFNDSDSYWRPIIVDPKSLKTFGVRDEKGHVAGTIKFKNAFLER
jgi:hypothetical protein